MEKYLFQDAMNIVKTCMTKWRFFIGSKKMFISGHLLTFCRCGLLMVMDSEYGKKKATAFR